MRSRKLLPFLQGELDALCGIYSIVNSLNWALNSLPRAAGNGSKPVPKLSDQDCVDLFGVLLSTPLAGNRGLHPIWQGVREKELVQLLQAASAWLTEYRSLRLSFNRPARGKSRSGASELHKSLAAHLSKPGTASIIGVYHPELHWSVVITTAPERLILCDSYGKESVRPRMLSPSGSKRRGKNQPRLVFFLTVGEAPASAPALKTTSKASPGAAISQPYSRSTSSLTRPLQGDGVTRVALGT
jgi:hypothetical protein